MPVSVHVPVPDLVSDVAPVPLLPRVAASEPAPVPVSVKPRAAFEPRSVTALVLDSVSAPEPEASSVPPAGLMVKARSVESPVPVYWSVPPASTRLAAALVDFPMELLVPPLASVLTESVPPLIVVVPV